MRNVIKNNYKPAIRTRLPDFMVGRISSSQAGMNRAMVSFKDSVQGNWSLGTPGKLKAYEYAKKRKNSWALFTINFISLIERGVAGIIQSQWRRWDVECTSPDFDL